MPASHDNFDPFQGSKDPYSLDEFYTRATNNHDHTVNRQLAMPRELWSHVEEVVRRGAFPYSSAQALVRDAVVHRLHYLSALEPGDFEGLAILNLQRVLSRQEAAAERRQAMRLMHAGVKTALDDATMANDWRDIRVICDNAEMDLEDVDESWRLKIEDEIGRARQTAEHLEAMERSRMG